VSVSYRHLSPGQTSSTACQCRCLHNRVQTLKAAAPSERIGQLHRPDVNGDPSTPQDLAAIRRASRPAAAGPDGGIEPPHQSTSDQRPQWLQSDCAPLAAPQHSGQTVAASLSQTEQYSHNLDCSAHGILLMWRRALIDRSVQHGWCQSRRSERHTKLMISLVAFLSRLNRKRLRLVQRFGRDRPLGFARQVIRLGDCGARRSSLKVA
jgi:hypothetical protein